MTLHLSTVDADPPPKFAEFEALVLASSAPAILIIDRELMRGLLTYLRRLECEAQREGSFW